MEEDTNSKKSPKFGVFVTVFVAVVAILVIFLVVRQGKAPSETETTTPAATVAPPKKLSAAEQTQALVDERMADKEYMAVLSKYQAEQTEIARQASALRGEIQSWVQSNGKALAVSTNIQNLVKTGAAKTEIEAAQKELGTVMRADPEGKRLLERQDDLNKAFEAVHAKISDSVGARIRLQTDPRRKSKEAK